MWKRISYEVIDNLFCKLRSSARNIERNRVQPTCLTECLDDKKTQSKRNYIKIYYFTIFILLSFFLNFMMSNGSYKTLMEYIFTKNEDKSSRRSLPQCFISLRNDFGKISVNKTVTEHSSEIAYPSVQKGGYYVPKECWSNHKVGIIIPYRNRRKNLFIFLFHIHKFLMRQKLEYRIFVIEQTGTDKFNRGSLLNAGFLEMKKYGDWRCVVFHDVDLLPSDDRILYSCPVWPRHMCASITGITSSKFRTLFGGVSSLLLPAFEKVNGYSNLYWGWGGEDNDLYWRLKGSGYPVVRYRSFALYTSLQHPIQKKNRLRYPLLRSALERFHKDGLSSIEYKVKSTVSHHLYTHVLVDINPYKRNYSSIIEKWVWMF